VVEMSVIKDMKLPAPPPTGMAARYEQAWNEVVEEQPPWKKKIIIENFDVVSGRHVYDNESDQRMMDDVVKEAVRRAEKKD
tara:strand:+ start:1670 stop:1912 length:243 start_codon:yes stop_codon:yes gene_type:complete